MTKTGSDLYVTKAGQADRLIAMKPTLSSTVRRGPGARISLDACYEIDFGFLPGGFYIVGGGGGRYQRIGDQTGFREREGTAIPAARMR